MRPQIFFLKTFSSFFPLVHGAMVLAEKIPQNLSHLYNPQNNGLHEHPYNIDSSAFEPTLMIKRHSHSINNQIRQLPG